jgi:hypothetical protein
LLLIVSIEKQNETSLSIADLRRETEAKSQMQNGNKAKKYKLSAAVG